jgi:DNA-binding GntR family transcriptional regulator
MAAPPYLVIVHEIMNQIRRGELNPGDQLPTTAKLAERYGVSIATAKRALATLTTLEITETVPGWATFVRASSQAIAHEEYIGEPGPVEPPEAR